MGLDMYLEGKKWLNHNFKDESKNQTEDGFPLKEKGLELAYWRKFHTLHDFIVQKFADGVDECQKIDLTAENLKTIIKFIETEVDGEQEDIDRDVKAVQKALDWLTAKADGEWRSVNYQASW